MVGGGSCAVGKRTSEAEAELDSDAARELGEGIASSLSEGSDAM